jgi:hypothetical protein
VERIEVSSWEITPGPRRNRLRISMSPSVIRFLFTADHQQSPRLVLIHLTTDKCISPLRLSPSQRQRNSIIPFLFLHKMLFSPKIDPHHFDGADRYCSPHCGEGSEPEVYEK